MLYKTVSKVCGFLSMVMIILVLIIGGTMIIPKLMGNEVFAVMSGSMEPFYHVGSVVIVDKDISPEDIQVGDPITFRKSDNLVATHRVVEKHEDSREFITKGDANEDLDMAPVPYEAVIGKAGRSVPFVGYIPLYMRTPKGMFSIGAYVIVFLLLQIIPEILKPEEPKKEGTEK